MWFFGSNKNGSSNIQSYHPLEQRKKNESVFTINGVSYTVTGSYPMDMSLNTFIRDVANLKGTKFMCEEGGCGCCIVTASMRNPATGQDMTLAVNSCLTFVLSCHGWSITTVEGLGCKQSGYHTLQKTLANFSGTQCGYCSPGMIMNMHSMLAANQNLTMQEVENAFGGNICRCTGYRPILDAFKSLCVDASQGVNNDCMDIEDIVNAQCVGGASATTSSTYVGHEETDTVCKAAIPIHITGVCGEWYRVDSIDDIFHIFRIINGSTYQLVAGNTGRGVNRVLAEPQVYIDVTPVAELHAVTVGDDSLVFGANITLAGFVASLRDSAARQGYSYCRQVAHHVDMLANVAVRNMATIAGNLFMKHQHNDFSSDIFLLLETVKANLVIRDISGNVAMVGPEEFLKLDMRLKVITQFVLYPLENYILKYYKVMPRAQNAHAIVNAGFLFKFSADGSYKFAEKPSIVYGAITPTFVHASSTENFLTYKDLRQEQTLAEALKHLAAEIEPACKPPLMGPAYRKGLALSLFYKCVLSIMGQKARKELVSGGETLRRPLSRGQQTFETAPSDYPVGQPVSKLEALPQCSGEAEFVYDRPTAPGELYAALVLTTVPNGNIVKISVDEALNSSGVVAFYSAQHIPGLNNIIPYLSPATEEDEELFCSGKVLYHGQPVGVIVAETRQAADKAKRLVKIDYSDVTKPMLHVRDVIPQGGQHMATKYSSRRIAKGKVTRVVEGKLDMGAQYHYHMEKQTCCVVPKEDGLEVYASTQWIEFCQQSIAQVLGVKKNSISMYVRRIGGAFGAKQTKATYVACSCALAAYHSLRPVRMVLTMEDNMSAIGKRDEVALDYKVGVNDNGEIQYLESYIYLNVGSTTNDNSKYFLERAFPNCYENDNWSVIIENVKTNTPSSAYTRSPGSINGIMSIENIMEHIAKETSVDPVQVRLNNIKEDDTMKKFIETIKESSDYTSRKLRIDLFNKENCWMKKGISLVPFKWPVQFFGNMHCMVSIYSGDGSVAVSHGGIEMGQGINTKVAQAVSFTLGIPMDLVVVKPTNNLTAANDICSSGSVASDSACFAATQCCKELSRRLQATAKSMKNPTWPALVSKAATSGVDLVASSMFSVANAHSYSVYGVCVQEITLDVLMGNFQIARADLLVDAGKSLSPYVDIGQIEGAFVMGLGLCTSEDIVYEENTGQLLTNRSWTYWPPGAKDIPVDFRIEIQKNMPNPVGVLRSKTTGEPATCLASALVFALRNAVESARRDAGDDGTWFDLRLPLTSEKIWEYCLVNPSSFSLS